MSYVMPNPSPRGVAIYAGRNSRQMGYGVYIGSNRIGYLHPNRLPDRVTWDTQRRYAVYNVHALAAWRLQRPTGAVVRQVVASRSLRGERIELFATGAQTGVGHACREWAVDANGTGQMKNDSTGMFEHVARAFRQLYNAEIRAFDNVHDDEADGGNEAATRANYFGEMAKFSGDNLDFFAYSGHGSQNGLPSAGVRHGRPAFGMPQLCERIGRLVRADGFVLLYACSTGEAGGFAEDLSRLLPRMTVIGHRGAAAASRNPEKYRIVNGNSEHYRDLLPADVRPRWTATNLDRNYLYARFPFLTVEQVAEELRT